MSRLWRIWLWKDPAVEDRVLGLGYISLSVDDLGDLSPDITDSELERRLRIAQPGKGDGAYRQFITYWRRFFEIAPGDYVLIAISNNRVTAARVLGPFERLDPYEAPELRYVHRIELLLGSPRHKSTLPRELEKRRDTQPTVLELKYDGAMHDFLGWVGAESDA